MKGFIYFLKFSWNANSKYIITVILKVIVSTFLGLSLILLPQFLIDSIINNQLLNIIMFAIINILITFLGNVFVEYLKANIYIQKNIVYNRFQVWFAEKQGRAKYEYIERNETKTLYEQASKYIYGFQGSQGFGTSFESFFELWGYIFTVFSVALLIFYLNVFILFIIISTVIITTLIKNKVNKLVYQTNMERVPYERKENYYKTLFSDYKYGKEIRINDLTKFFLKKYDENLSKTNYFYKKI